LLQADCRYALYDIEYDTNDGGKRAKLVFIVWYVAGALACCVENMLVTGLPANLASLWQVTFAIVGPASVSLPALAAIHLLHAHPTRHLHIHTVVMHPCWPPTRAPHTRP